MTTQAAAQGEARRQQAAPGPATAARQERRLKLREEMAKLRE